MSRKRPSDQIIKGLYLKWLNNVTLRQIAAEYPVYVCHSTIAVWFRSLYGKNATSIQNRSLQRSLLEDYPDNDEVKDFVTKIAEHTDGNYYRSKHGEDELTRYHVVHDYTLLEKMVPVYDTDPSERIYWDFLRLPYVLVWLDTVVATLRSLSDGW